MCSPLGKPREPTDSAQPAGILYGRSSMQNSGLQNRKMRGHGLPPVPNAGSLPPVKARRRQNTIDQPERCKQSGKPIRSAARWQTATGLCEPEKVCPHSEVRNKTSTANRRAGINAAGCRRAVRGTNDARQPCADNTGNQKSV